jgi:DNA-binding NarL/FixJ family response regulator
MGLFSQTELRVLDALAAGKSLKKLGETSNLSEGTLEETVEGLKAKLDASTQSELADRFVAVTGWTNPPKDYPQ